jgi:hypothetical protein
MEFVPIRSLRVTNHCVTFCHALCHTEPNGNFDLLLTYFCRVLLVAVFSCRSFGKTTERFT